MTNEHELFSELRAARRARGEAITALKEARTVLKQCERTIEDIMSEIDTGKAVANSRTRPLLDAINAAQPSPDLPSIENVEWTSTDLERVLAAACHPDGVDPNGIWGDMKRVGCNEAKILEILRAIWPVSPYFRNVPPPGCTIRGGSIPALWMGYARSPRKLPTLAGLELADRIRRVLEIPRMQVFQDHTLSGSQPAREHALAGGKPRKMTRRSRRPTDDPA